MLAERDAEVLPERTAEVPLVERTAELVPAERAVEVLPERTAVFPLVERAVDPVLAERTAWLTDAVRAVVLPATSEPALLTCVMLLRDALVEEEVRDAMSAVRLVTPLEVPIASDLEMPLTLFPFAVPLG